MKTNWWGVMRSIFLAIWTTLMVVVLFIDWGDKGIAETLVYDASGVLHEEVYLAAFGAAIIWYSTKLEGWCKK